MLAFRYRLPPPRPPPPKDRPPPPPCAPPLKDRLGLRLGLNDRLGLLRLGALNDRLGPLYDRLLPRDGAEKLGREDGGKLDREGADLDGIDREELGPKGSDRVTPDREGAPRGDEGDE